MNLPIDSGNATSGSMKRLLYSSGYNVLASSAPTERHRTADINLYASKRGLTHVRVACSARIFWNCLLRFHELCIVDKRFITGRFGLNRASDVLTVFCMYFRPWINCIFGCLLAELRRKPEGHRSISLVATGACNHGMYFHDEDLCAILLFQRERVVIHLSDPDAKLLLDTFSKVFEPEVPQAHKLLGFILDNLTSWTHTRWQMNEPVWALDIPLSTIARAWAPDFARETSPSETTQITSPRSASTSRRMEALQAECCLLADLPSNCRLVTRSLCTFCLTLRLCELPLKDWFPECVVRLAGDGVLRFYEDEKSSSIACIFPFLAMPTSSRLKAACTSFNKIIHECSRKQFSLSSTSSLLDRFFLAHLVGPAGDSLKVFLFHIAGIEFLPESISRLRVQYPETKLAHRTLTAPNASYRLTFTEFVTLANCEGCETRVIFILYHPVFIREFGEYGEWSDCLQTSLITRREAPRRSVSDRTPEVVLHIAPFGTFVHVVEQEDGYTRSVLIDANSGIKTAFCVPLDFVLQRSLNDRISHLFNAMKHRIPWWGVSSRQKSFDRFTKTRLGIKCAKFRVLVKRYKTTGLSLMKPSKWASTLLDIPLEELEEFSQHAESFRLKEGMVKLSSVSNLRQLVRCLLTWGTELTEILELKSFLRRRRIHSLEPRNVNLELLNLSPLALGTKISVMVVVEGNSTPF